MPCQRITAYDKRTEVLTLERDVPADLVNELRFLARVPSDDVEMLGSYPLDGSVMRHVSERLGFSESLDGYDWFLEPFDEP